MPAGGRFRTFPAFGRWKRGTGGFSVRAWTFPFRRAVQGSNLFVCKGSGFFGKAGRNVCPGKQACRRSGAIDSRWPAENRTPGRETGCMARLRRFFPTIGPQRKAIGIAGREAGACRLHRRKAGAIPTHPFCRAWRFLMELASLFPAGKPGLPAETPGLPSSPAFAGAVPGHVPFVARITGQEARRHRQEKKALPGGQAGF